MNIHFKSNLKVLALKLAGQRVLVDKDANLKNILILNKIEEEMNIFLDSNSYIIGCKLLDVHKYIDNVYKYVARSINL